MSEPRDDEDTGDQPSESRSISPKTAFEMGQATTDKIAENQGETINGLRTQLAKRDETDLTRDKWTRWERGFWVVAILVLAGKAIGLEIPGIGSFTGGGE